MCFLTFVTLAEAQVASAVPVALVDAKILDDVLAQVTGETVDDAANAPDGVVRHAPALGPVQASVRDVTPVVAAPVDVLAGERTSVCGFGRHYKQRLLH